jgi:4-hydroxy-tetrahydrodipicolinate synthase
MFRGVYTAIVTPFADDGSLDLESFDRLIEFQIENGIDGIVPVGTTGESPTLSIEEHIKVIQRTCKTVNKRTLVIAGAGSNNTKEAIELATAAKDAGADGTLQVAPYYNKPTQEGFYRHYIEIADAVDLPHIVYNIPPRTGKNIETDTMIRMAEHQNIVGVKEASGSIIQMMSVIERAPSDFSVLSGDDAITLPLTAAGGMGLISVSSNLFPGLMRDLVHSGLDGDFQKMRDLNYKLQPLFRIMNIEQNPIPIKTALAIKGYVKEIFRLPICGLIPENKKKLESFLADFK